MLAPQDRQVFLEALRPPEGYVLDRAVGTTYSLDLLALLSVPLSFTFFEWDDKNGRPTQDPLALLEAVRRYGKRISLFCQAGQTYVPRQIQLVLGYLEHSVVEVKPPSGQGVFHPKIWVLRFVAPAKPVVYRFLCLTRNLTFDRSWDALVALEGELTDRRNAFALNHPLADFVRDLPSLALFTPSAAVLESCELMQTELRRVAFVLPEGFESYAFWPLGMPKYSKWPFQDKIDRMLVISPFLSGGMLSRLNESGEDNILISTVEELAKLNSEALADFKECYVFGGEENPVETEENEESPDGENALTGLHAKIYLADAGWDARVWIGSANATDAAFRQNVEFLVELVGKKSMFGVSAVLSKEQGSTGLTDLLQPFSASDQTIVENELEGRLKKRLEEAKRTISSLGLHAKIVALEEGGYSVEIRCGKTELLLQLNQAKVICWPINLPQDPWGSPLIAPATGGVLARFTPLSFEALTTFTAFEVKVEEATEVARSRFVLNLPVIGMPPGREERLLTSLLSDRGKVLRYLYFLLAEGEMEASGLATLISQQAGSAGDEHKGFLNGLPLFETMVKALERDPERLDQVAKLIADLKRTSEGQALLPEDFDKAWEPIWAVREELRRGV